MFRPTTAFAAVAMTACIAYAQPDSVRRDVQVRYSDLDLSTDNGARIMLGRIERAADQACSHSPYWRNPDEPHTGFLLKNMRSCHEQAVAQAVATLRAPAVSRLYAESRGRHPGWYAGR